MKENTGDEVEEGGSQLVVSIQISRGTLLVSSGLDIKVSAVLVLPALSSSSSEKKVSGILV